MTRRAKEHGKTGEGLSGVCALLLLRASVSGKFICFIGIDILKLALEILGNLKY